MSSKYVSKPVAFNFFFPMDLKISPIIYISFTCIPQGPRHHGNCRGDWEKISHLPAWNGSSCVSWDARLTDM